MRLLRRVQPQALPELGAVSIGVRGVNCLPAEIAL
jgi:hypothetical protein